MQDGDDRTRSVLSRRLRAPGKARRIEGQLSKDDRKAAHSHTHELALLRFPRSFMRCESALLLSSRSWLGDGRKMDGGRWERWRGGWVRERESRSGHRSLRASERISPATSARCPFALALFPSLAAISRGQDEWYRKKVPALLWGGLRCVLVRLGNAIVLGRPVRAASSANTYTCILQV